MVFRWWTIETFQQGSLGWESSGRLSVLVKSSSISTISIIMSTTGWNNCSRQTSSWVLEHSHYSHNNDYFPKCCEVVTTLHEQIGQVKGLWFDTHIVIMTIFSQPEFKSWPLFVSQSFICQLVSSRSMVHVVGFDIQRDIGGVGCIHICLTS